MSFWLTTLSGVVAFNTIAYLTIALLKIPPLSIRRGEEEAPVRRWSFYRRDAADSIAPLDESRSTAANPVGSTAHTNGVIHPR